MRKANMRPLDVKKRVVVTLVEKPKLQQPVILFRKNMKYAFEGMNFEEHKKPTVNFNRMAYNLIPALIKGWNKRNPTVWPTLQDNGLVLFHGQPIKHAQHTIVCSKPVAAVKEGAVLEFPRYQFVWAKGKSFYRLKPGELLQDMKTYTNYLIVFENTVKEKDTIKLVNYSYQTGSIKQVKTNNFVAHKAPVGHDWHEDLKHVIKTS